MRSRIPLTREEKERKVIELYRKGMNIRDISKRAHMSFGDIGGITRKLSGDDKLERAKKYSTHSQALELFQKGYSLLEVAKKLDLTYSQTVGEYNQYMSLIGFDKFAEFYNERRGDLASYISLDQQLRMAGISAKDAIEGISFARQLDEMRIQYNDLWSQAEQLRQEHTNLSGIMLILRQERDSVINEIEASEKLRNDQSSNIGTLQPITETAPKKIRRR